MHGSRSTKLQRSQRIYRKKTEPMSSADLAACKIKLPIMLALEAAKGDRPAADVAVFDVGCGRGDAIAALRRRGYRAFGGEINDAQLAIARESMARIGYDPAIIHDLKDAADRPPAEAFDFVFSDNVVEHVEDLSGFLDEIRRILKPGGMTCHLYPSTWRVMEPHLRQPCVHWLPGGWPQRALISGLTAVGIEPWWVETSAMTRREKARVYAEYMRSSTCYRSVGECRRLYAALFEDVRYEITGHVLVRRLPLLRRLKLTGLMQWASIHFHTTVVTMKKPDRAEMPCRVRDGDRLRLADAM